MKRIDWQSEAEPLHPWLALVSLMCVSEVAIALIAEQQGYGMVNWDSIPGRAHLASYTMRTGVAWQKSKADHLPPFNTFTIP